MIMKNTFPHIRSIFALIIVLMIFGCKKEAVPIIETNEVTNITTNTAVCGGKITYEGSSTVSARGICWSTSMIPTISDFKTTDGAGAGSYSSSMSGLEVGTVYYVRAYASNSFGTGYGITMSFTTLGQSPAANIAAATNITTSSAKLNGIVNANFLSTIVTFEYGTTTGYGNTITSIQSPIAGNSNINVSAEITGLNPETTYHTRIIATNSIGTIYSSDMTFTTGGFVTDIDGNIYHTVIIGPQVWMVENLKTTKYRNGINIPNITDDISWYNLETGAYCDHGNIPSNSDLYGRLYNWYVVIDSRNICPTGWHVPSDDEWSLLITYLGGSYVAGGKLKEIGTTHWRDPNTGADNSSGFTALPGGLRTFDGLFKNINSAGYWWSSTKNPSELVWTQSMNFSSSYVRRYDEIDRSGFSIRCIKD